MNSYQSCSAAIFWRPVSEIPWDTPVIVLAGGLKVIAFLDEKGLHAMEGHGLPDPKPMPEKWRYMTRDEIDKAMG